MAIEYLVTESGNRITTEDGLELMPESSTAPSQASMVQDLWKLLGCDSTVDVAETINGKIDIMQSTLSGITIPTPPTVEAIAAEVVAELTIPTPPTKEEIAAEVMSSEIGDGTTTLAQASCISVAVLAGKSSGHPTAPKFRDLGDTKDVVAGTVDEDGNRSAVTVTP